MAKLCTWMPFSSLSSTASPPKYIVRARLAWNRRNLLISRRLVAEARRFCEHDLTGAIFAFAKADRICCVRVLEGVISACADWKKSCLGLS
jgi:hypothetical protein